MIWRCYLLLGLFGLSYSQNRLFWRWLRCISLYFFSFLFSLFSFSNLAALCFLNWYFMILSIKRHSHVNIIHQDNWALVPSNQRKHGYTLLNHHFEPQCNISPNLETFYISKNQFSLCTFNAWYTDIKWIHFLDAGQMSFSYHYFSKQYR